jgi:predicted nucleotidyltransferase
VHASHSSGKQYGTLEARVLEGFRMKLPEAGPTESAKILLIFRSSHMTLQFDQNEVNRIAQLYRIKELALFGSAVRDDFNKDSDVDLLVVFEDDADLSYFDIMEIKQEFEKLFHRQVDIVEKAAIKNPYRRNTILNNARTIYAA